MQRRALVRAEESNRLNKELQGASGTGENAPSHNPEPQPLLQQSDDYERCLNELRKQLRKEARRSERLRVQLQEAQERPQVPQVSQAAFDLLSGQLPQLALNTLSNDFLNNLLCSTSSPTSSSLCFASASSTSRSNAHRLASTCVSASPLRRSVASAT